MMKILKIIQKQLKNTQNWKMNQLKHTKIINHQTQFLFHPHINQNLRKTQKLKKMIKISNTVMDNARGSQRKPPGAYNDMNEGLVALLCSHTTGQLHLHLCPSCDISADANNCLLPYQVGNVTGNPGVFWGNLHPFPHKPAPAHMGADLHRNGSWVE